MPLKKPQTCGLNKHPQTNLSLPKQLTCICVILFLSLPNSKYAFQVVIFGNAKLKASETQFNGLRVLIKQLKKETGYNSEGDNLLAVFIAPL